MNSFDNVLDLVLEVPKEKGPVTAGPLPDTTSIQQIDPTAASEEHVYGQVPAWMREAKRWLLWKSEPGNEGQKPRKVPFYATGEKRGVTDTPEDAAALATFDKAVAELQSGKYAGLGFALGRDKNGGCWQGIDFDHISEHPENQGEIDMLEMQGAYVETSPSGDGLHGIGYGEHFKTIAKNAQGFEAYAGGRFFTVTGRGVSTDAPVDLSDYVNGLCRPKFCSGETGTGGAAPDDLTAMVRAIKLAEVSAEDVDAVVGATKHLAAAGQADGYAEWLMVGQGLKSIAQGKPEFEEQMLALWHEFSSASAKYDQAKCQAKWDEDIAPRAMTYKTILGKAQELGYVNPASAEARRIAQRKRNQEIGEQFPERPMTEVITLEGALERFVFQSDGSRVSDCENPHFEMTFTDFANTYLSSTTDVVVKTPDGSRMKTVPVAKVWLADPTRQTVEKRTFQAGGPRTTYDPDNYLSFNSWRDHDRQVASTLPDCSLAMMFLDHVEWLWGDRTDEFLDWLAHIEQCPGVLPHTAWLHIAGAKGLGRNWISSVLCRVWPGYVASNFDLVGSMKSSFNGRLSHKLLAQVDELNEGMVGAGRWQHSEQLKSMLNAEKREIKPKYGREFVEHNAVRWLMFSNHLTAIPIEGDDRRVEVVVCDAQPRPADYYIDLYAQVDNPAFIASIAKFLMERDLSSFNPGRRAKATESKNLVVERTMSEADTWAHSLVEHWPYDVVPAWLIVEAIAGIGGVANSSRHPADRAGIVAYIPPGKGKPSPIKIDGNPMRVSILRNAEQWQCAGNSAVRDEVMRSMELASTGQREVREILEDLSASE